MGYQLENVNCDFCGSNKLKLFAEQKDLIHKMDSTSFQVVSCHKCGLKFTNPRPTKDSIDYFYNTKYSFHLYKSKSFLLTKKILKIVSKSILAKNYPLFCQKRLIKF